ncbi:hypothetical protein C2845_PM18G12740 [Panicum miliaceum]|uniref:Uncharacterized protein n=1 Tax=Panicum miliaceum TaxID=4540 RepID=A0A3L6PIU5_PANMI|nr:hypothetical protein C2845_PM18G12740 [Panicum miliaceum]
MISLTLLATVECGAHLPSVGSTCHPLLFSFYFSCEPYPFLTCAASAGARPCASRPSLPRLLLAPSPADHSPLPRPASVHRLVLVPAPPARPPLRLLCSAGADRLRSPPSKFIRAVGPCLRSPTDGLKTARTGKRKSVKNSPTTFVCVPAPARRHRHDRRRPLHLRLPLACFGCATSRRKHRFFRCFVPEEEKDSGVESPLCC